MLPQGAETNTDVHGVEGTVNMGNVKRELSAAYRGCEVLKQEVKVQKMMYTQEGSLY